jgi:hypothetical protein
MDSLRDTFIKPIADGIFDLLAPRVLSALDRYFTREITVCFTELEAAEKLHISVKTLQRMAVAGEIDYCHIRGKRNYTLAQIQDYIYRNSTRCFQPKFEMQKGVSLLGAESRITPIRRAG